ncbi:acyltransferase family protein [Xanthobacter flavus]|uniref:acyltransferase family protein n=1 Tax=Xanthobacter flavus TaxID=281 RepID=UPI003729CE75
MLGNTSRTLGQQLALSGGRPSGFDYLRVILATAVLASHTVNVGMGREATAALWTSPGRVILAAILPMFFALSGFLVAGSLERCPSLVSFLGLRALRIVPALAVETLLSAIILGAIFTTLPLKDYYINKLFFQYTLNMVGWVHYYLPGVFANNPWGQHVNQQLWTLPFELEAYIALAVLVVLGAIARIRVLFVGLLLLIVFCAMFGVSSDIKMPVWGYALIVAFLFGVCFYRLRDFIILSGPIAVAAFLAGSLFLFMNGAYDIMAMPFLAYFTVYLGLLNPPRSKIVTSGDYSYGIFLYGFPIQQSVAAVLGHHSWWLNLVISLPITVVVAVLSWHLIEKNALKLRKYLFTFERWCLAKLSPLGGVGSHLLGHGEDNRASPARERA